MEDEKSVDVKKEGLPVCGRPCSFCNITTIPLKYDKAGKYNYFDTDICEPCTQKLDPIEVEETRAKRHHEDVVSSFAEAIENLMEDYEVSELPWDEIKERINKKAKH